MADVAGRPRRGPTDWGRHLASRVGSPAAAALVAGGGVALIMVVMVPLGALAAASETGIDRPFLAWSEDHLDSAWLTAQMEKITLLGDIPMTQVLGLLGTLVLALCYGRRWWVPVLVVGYGYLVERVVQVQLAHLIDRGAPPGETGTFPSGGVGRPLAVYGAVLACALALSPSVDRTTRRWLVGGLVALVTVIGASRLWLGKHWLSDVITAIPFGLLLLATVFTLAGTLHPSPKERDGEPGD